MFLSFMYVHNAQGFVRSSVEIQSCQSDVGSILVRRKAGATALSNGCIIRAVQASPVLAERRVGASGS